MYRWIRNFHLFTGLFCGAYLLMYGVSAVQMSHNSWFNARPTVTERVIALGQMYDGVRPLARELMERHGVVGEVQQVTSVRERMAFRMVGAGSMYEVEYDPARREAKVKTSVTNFSGFLNRLHHLAGLWHEYWLLNAFGVFVGVVSALLIPMALSGIYLWFKLHDERIVGGILLAVSLSFSLALTISMRAGL